MKKLLLTFVIALMAVITMAFCASAVSVTDDGTNLILGDCVIEDLGREIPQASAGFTFNLDDSTMTAKITKWANYADKELGKALVIPSTVTYEGKTYTVTGFDRVAYGTDNGKGETNQGNFILSKVYISDTVIAIPNNAFDSCKGLEYVYVGSGVETIGEMAFNFAGASAGSYYAEVDGNYVIYEKTGGTMGDIKEFIFKTTKIRTLERQVFWHTEFTKDAIIEFPIELITTYKSYCIGLNQHALTDDHQFKGTNIRFDVWDIRNATIENDAFVNCNAANVVILNADQTKYFNANCLKGGASGYYSENDNDAVIIVCGGETAETAKTLTGPIWTSNPYYWYGSTVFMNVVFRGYVNAYDGVDGLENQNGYGTDLVNYFFESKDAFDHYIASVETTTSAGTTLTRYAKNTRGYFNVCNGDGTATQYNLTYADSVATISEYTTGTPLATPTLSYVVDGNCTASKVCACCEIELVKGVPHNVVTTLVYENGFFKAGVKTVACTNDGCQLCNEEALKPIFYWVGYSAKTFGEEKAFGQQYVINQAELGDYKAYVESQGKTFSYGVVAAGSSSAGQPLSVVGNEVVNKEGAQSICFDQLSYDAFFMNISGIDAGSLDVALMCCAYVRVGDEIVYLDNNQTVDTVELTSFAKIDAIVNPKEEIA